VPRGRKLSPEQIVVMLRQIEVLVGQGKSLALACKEAGISEQGRDRVLARPLQSYPTHTRPHSSLGYRPPAPVTRAVANHLPTSPTMQSSHKTRAQIPVRSPSMASPPSSIIWRSLAAAWVTSILK
jgi:putative transposase